MSLPYVYADFNALPGAFPASKPGVVAMEVTGYGTLASLSQQRVRLTEGMRLVIYEPMDIECEVTMHFQPELKSPSGSVGAWVALLNPNDIRDCTSQQETAFAFPCFNCGAELSEYLSVVGRQYKERCPKCGTSVMTAMEAPDAP